MLHIHIKKTRYTFMFSIALLVTGIVWGGFYIGRHDSISRGFDRITSSIHSLEYRGEYNRWYAPTALAAPSDTQARTVPILLYHGIVQKADRFSLTDETFKEQLFALKRAGYQTITMKQFISYMKNDTPLPDKSFLLTFDDGRSDSYKQADPILKALGFTAVMFVATHDSLGETQTHYYIDENDIKNMLASTRWEIGSHAIQETGGYVPIDAVGTQANFLCNKAWIDGHLESDEQYRARISRELKNSKQVLEKTFGVPVASFSYPFGDYGQQSVNYPEATNVIAEIIQETYSVAFQQVWDTDTAYSTNQTIDNPYHLRRIEVPTTWTGSELAAALERIASKQLPYTDTFEKNTGWRSLWGAVDRKDGALNISARNDTTGAFTLLEGTNAWDNYFYTVEGEWDGGETVTLIAHYRDAGTYQSCTFSDSMVRATETKENSTTVLDEAKHWVIIPHAQASFGMYVDDDILKCYIGDRAIAIGYTAGRELTTGGIGVKVWSEALGASSFILKNVRVVSSVSTKVLLSTLPRPVTR